MRNILFIHLESLNYAVYQTNKRLFPTLRRWEQKSISFSNYFSTATSTMMVFSDLAYGGMLQNEPCNSLTDGLQKYCYDASLFDDLQKAGYQVKMVGYPLTNCDDVEKSNERHFVGYGMELKEIGPYTCYLNALDNAMSEEKPFAVWACNYINNVSCYHFIENISPQTGLDMWETGYTYMDKCVDDLLKILEKKDLVENTTIVFYGDHGDDLFSHGRHRGLTHAIEPYAWLIHTPFWIYDSRFASGEVRSLIDTTDIRYIVKELLCLSDKVEKKYRTDDLRLPFREYSFARNVYAGQKVREGSFHKSYSLTDGTFLFLAGDEGMELYHIGMDAPCQHNLLDYFIYQNDTLTLNKSLYNKMRFHFPNVIDKGALIQIEQIFYTLRKRLIKEVETIFQYAECPNYSLEIDFENIRYGWEEQERRLYEEKQEQNIISEIINHLLNNMQIARFAVYGDTSVELKGIYPTIKQYKLSQIEDDNADYEVLYIALQNLKELTNIKTWIEQKKETTTMIIYIKDWNETDTKLEKQLDIIYKYQNLSVLKGTLYFIGGIFDYPDSLTVPDSFKVLAIMHFYNEADILDMTIQYLLSQELDIYLVDNWSDDGSYEIAQYYKETYPKHVFLERFPIEGSITYYDWYHQLEHTEDIAAKIDYDWYIHYDVDEMRVGVWKDKTLRDTIYYVDKLGFNAIDNIVIDFKLTQNAVQNIFMSNTYFDFRYSTADFHHRKTWKKIDKLDLKKTGGHIAKFQNPKVFPLKILNRHYPFRSVEQAYKKVFIDRKPRFEKENKERGWHGHYDQIIKKEDLLVDKNKLILWDDAVCDKYYVSLFLGCGIPIDDKEEFDIYKRYLEGKRVVLYGAGNYGKYFYENMAECSDIVAWVDQEYAYLPWICCKKIQPIEDIKDLEFDAIFIAIVNHKIKQEVEEQLICMGISKQIIY